ncbi:MAG: bifunctional (p)ppGpp synthetase/guanosine-3',5'-bis(diphosphate) 3'-pyrophosphohydrolase [Firmicutes bacterium]|nr:bifunctional (p)ppGpp synthetase/guanosine-3',5'-bis(diphosphate) 3'-pyrophosphohydrolase [Bacillota bacterium]
MQQYEQLYDELIEKMKRYHPNQNFEMVEKAYNLAREAHGEQLRKSGEPYIIHPLCVAIILAELELDIESIVAGLLHDVVEDTKYTCEEISEIFNPEVALLVDGVTKLEKIKYSSKEELQADNYRKMFLAMAKDIRVILIKVADRLHNMRTLKYMTPAKQKEKAQETIDIYAPLADRLGISKIKTELEDLSLRYLESEAYYDLADKIKRKQSEREEYVQKIVDILREKCDEAHIECEIYGRPKHFFSIYKKMHNQNKTLDQIFDLFAVRVIVNTVRDCYEVLGIVHELYKPIPSRFKDYIAMPKANMYQSLHNTLIGPEGLPFEVQIRTWEMHRIAEYGIAAHWKYKAGISGTESDLEEAKLSWLRQILEWQKDMSDNKEFMDTIKTDLNAYSDNVYCFSPTGEVKSLPADSTPVDFAYSIHSAIGNKMVGARVNGRIVTFDYKIQNGDRVEIVTSQNSRGPSMDWLKFCKSGQARNKINQWYKKINKEENIIRGKELLEKECKKKNLSLTELTAKPERVKNVLERYSFKDWDSICAAVGHGGLKEGQIINRLNEQYQKELFKTKTAEENAKAVEEELKRQMNKAEIKEVKKKNRSGVIMKDVGDISVNFKKCCNPVPGDEIVGYITKSSGVSIHRTDCVNIINMSEEERKRFISVQWDTQASGNNSTFLVEIRVTGEDRIGYLGDITRITSEEGLSIRSVNARMQQGTNVAIVDISVLIKNKSQLEILCKKIRALNGVYDIERITT